MKANKTMTTPNPQPTPSKWPGWIMAIAVTIGLLTFVVAGSGCWTLTP